MVDAKIIQLGSGGQAGRGSRGSPSASARRLAPPQAGRRSASRADGAAAGAQARSRTAPESRDSETRAPPPKSDATPGPEETPRRSVSGALLSELLGLGSRSLESLKSLPIAQLRALAGDPVHALASLAQALGVDLDSSVEETLAFLRQRLEGDYAVDEFGFDPEFTTKIYLPLLRQIADHWFRVEVRGAENLPMDGSALLVSNHAGALPLDGMILHTVVYDEIGRHVRMLGADLIFKTPYSGDLARKTGTTLACQEDAERLLASNQLVAVFPEGFKGIGKPYADRYKLQRFGRGGFVTAAIRAQVPIIPIAIVGSEEIYPLIAKAPALARALGVPYFPITPLFPWFGPLGMIPLPSKWIIQFGEAITTDELGPGAADDPMTVFNITDQVRETIQQTLYALLMQRRSAFF
jgi:1-acyl-sn-glycerol-3-phosphate acyltransferase